MNGLTLLNKMAASMEASMSLKNFFTVHGTPDSISIVHYFSYIYMLLFSLALQGWLCWALSVLILIDGNFNILQLLMLDQKSLNNVNVNLVLYFTEQRKAYTSWLIYNMYKIKIRFISLSVQCIQLFHFQVNIQLSLVLLKN